MLEGPQEQDTAHDEEDDLVPDWMSQGGMNDAEPEERLEPSDDEDEEEPLGQEFSWSDEEEEGGALSEDDEDQVIAALQEDLDLQTAIEDWESRESFETSNNQLTLTCV